MSVIIIELVDCISDIASSNSYSSLFPLFLSVQLIPPGGNTTFDIVFLARVPGNVENTIFIHTSAGTSPYQVSTVNRKGHQIYVHFI